MVNISFPSRLTTDVNSARTNSKKVSSKKLRKDNSISERHQLIRIM